MGQTTRVAPQSWRTAAAARARWQAPHTKSVGGARRRPRQAACIQASHSSHCSHRPEYPSADLAPHRHSTRSERLRLHSQNSSRRACFVEADSCACAWTAVTGGVAAAPAPAPLMSQQCNTTAAALPLPLTACPPPPLPAGQSWAAAPRSGAPQCRPAVPLSCPAPSRLTGCRPAPAGKTDGQNTKGLKGPDLFMIDYLPGTYPPMTCRQGSRDLGT